MNRSGDPSVMRHGRDYVPNPSRLVPRFPRGSLPARIGMPEALHHRTSREFRAFRYFFRRHGVFNIQRTVAKTPQLQPNVSPRLTVPVSVGGEHVVDVIDDV